MRSYIIISLFAILVLAGCISEKSKQENMQTSTIAYKPVNYALKQIQVNTQGEALPDLYFGNVEIKKTGRAVALNFTISNRGLVESKNVSIGVEINNNMIISYDLSDPIQPRASWINWHEVYIEEDFDSITLIIDPSNVQKELDKENNIMTLRRA